MGIYLGKSNKLKISASKTGILRVHVPGVPQSPTVNGVMLKSSDNYILKDINGLYLTAKEDK